MDYMDKLHKILSSNKNVCINIYDYTAIVQEKFKNKNEIWKNFKLMNNGKGVFGTLDTNNVYCSNLIKKGIFRIATVDDPDVRNEQNWSAEQSIDSYEGV